MMKESVGSLKGYFIVVGFLGLLIGFWSVYVFFVSVSIGVLSTAIVALLLTALLSIAQAVFVLYLGFGLKTLIVTNPKRIIRYLQIFCIALPVVSALIGYFLVRSINFVSLIISLLVGWYLITNVKRLSTQPVGVPTTPTPPVQ